MLVGVPVLVEAAVVGVGMPAVSVRVRMGVRGRGSGGSAGEAVDELDGVCGHRGSRGASRFGVCEVRRARACVRRLTVRCGSVDEYSEE